MSASKQKGTAFESAVRDFLIEAGFPGVERRSLYGAQDRGDISGLPDWTVECKNLRAMDLAGAVDEAMAESHNAHTQWGAAIVKRRGKNVREAYVVMPLQEFAAFLRQDRLVSAELATYRKRKRQQGSSNNSGTPRPAPHPT